MSSDPGLVDDLIAGVTVIIYLFVGFVGAVLLLIIFFVVRGLHSIQLSERLPGAFDDSEQFFEEEATALELMDDPSKQSYLMAKRWIEHNPPNSADTDISLSQYMTIQEKAVAAWEFTSDILQQPMLNIHNRTEIDFRASKDMCSVQTNLPLPKQKEVYYWETKIYDMAPDTKIAVGLTTKPYPGFRLPGMHRYSVSYESQAIYRLNQPFSGITYGRQWQRGDVIGVGFRTRTGSVFFTHNGRKLDDVAHGMRVNLFPTVGTIGAANLYVNLGQDGFVFIQANVKEWGLAPAQGSLAPPPAYGHQDDSLLLESTHLSSSASVAGPSGLPSGLSSANSMIHGGQHRLSGAPIINNQTPSRAAGVTSSHPESPEAPPYVQRRSSDEAHLSVHSLDIHTPPGSPPPALPSLGEHVEPLDLTRTPRATAVNNVSGQAPDLETTGDNNQTSDSNDSEHCSDLSTIHPSTSNETSGDEPASPAGLPQEGSELMDSESDDSTQAS